jgi:glutaredoxin-related protein
MKHAQLATQALDQLSALDARNLQGQYSTAAIEIVIKNTSGTPPCGFSIQVLFCE